MSILYPDLAVMVEAQVQVAPPAPALPVQAQPPGTPPATPEPNIVQLPTQPRVYTKEGIDALRSQRSELSRQLNSAQGRRDEASSQLNSATSPTERTGLEQRLIVLDDRIAQIERDIASTGQELVFAQVGLSTSAASAPRYGPFSSGQLTSISIVSIVLVWAPLAFAMARVMLKRWAVPRAAPQVIESAERLQRMEQAMDAVAIEVERISEGQRYVTQLMAAKQPAPVLNAVHEEKQERPL